MCGVPRTLRMDWGKVYRSEHLTRFVNTLGIEPSDPKAYSPWEKGKIERAFRTIHGMFEQLQPGHCPGDNTGDEGLDPTRDFKLVGEERGHHTISSRPEDGMVSPFSPPPSSVWIDPRSGEPLLTLAELNARFAEWVVGEYHCKHHSSTGATPAALWAANITPELSAIPDRQLLFEHLLLPVPGGGRRTVARGSVEVSGLSFTHPTLAGFEGMRIEVRRDLSDLSRVWCFNERGFCFCEAECLQPVVLGEQSDWRQWSRLAKASRARDRELRDAERAILAKPALARSLHDRIHAAAAAAPPLSLQERGPGGEAQPWQPPSSAEDEKLAQVTIGGIPLRRAAGE